MPNHLLVNILKKIDQYLLHHFPSVWITRVHIFLPIGAFIVALLYWGNRLIGWDRKDDLPKDGAGFLYLIIPVLIYLVYWFIFQSRYNVLKSGGKMSIGKEYLNFSLYFLVFFVAFVSFLAVPISDNVNVRNVCSPAEIRQDHLNLDYGKSIVNAEVVATEIRPGIYKFGINPFAYSFHEDIQIQFQEFDPDDYRYTVTWSKEKIYEVIEAYVASFNKFKYPDEQIRKSTESIFTDFINTNEYGSTNNYYHGYDVQRKISRIERLQEQSFWMGRDFDSRFWKISCAIIAWIALIVWMFKQMKLRQFIFAFISMCLTPLLFGIIAGIYFGIFRMDDPSGYLVLILLCYVVIILTVFGGYFSYRYSPTVYVLTMYLQFFLPLIPYFVFALLLIGNDTYWSREQDLFNSFYWASVLIGLSSIAVFKPIYTRYLNLPENK
jgi:hypothetical protein